MADFASGLLIRSSEQGSPSYMVGSFLETILLAKLEQPASAQPATKQKDPNTPPQPATGSTKQQKPPADPKPAAPPPEPSPRPDLVTDAAIQKVQQPPRSGPPGATTVTLPPRGGATDHTMDVCREW